MKKRLAFILLLLCCLLPSIAAAAAGTEGTQGKTGIDVVIVIDTSGSMKATDPDKIATDAAKLFIDMLEAEGSNVGLVPFSDELGTIYPMTELGGREDKEKLKKAIESLVITGDTDMGMAVKKGYQMLKDMPDTGNQKTLLFFTDGKIDLGSKRVRTDAISLEDVRETVKAAEEDGIPMYTLGLNANGSVDKLLLADMAEQTGGRSYIVDTADSLPGIFNEIFADFISSNIVDLGEVVTDGKNYSEVPFTIPNGSVLEANVILLTDKKLGEIKVSDPSGKTVSEDGKNLILTSSNQYHMVKLVRPEKGGWVLKVKGEKNLKIQVNLIFNYDIVLQGSAFAEANEQGQPVIKIEGYFSRDGEPVEDAEFYGEFTAKAIVAKDGKETGYELQYADGRFSGTAVPEENGEYSVRIEANSDTVYRVTGDMPVAIDGVTASDNSGAATAAPETKESSETKEPTQAETKEPVPQGTDQKQDGNGKNDQDGRKSPLSLILLIAGGAVLLVILLILIAKTAKRGNAQWYGRIRWTVSNGGSGGREQSYDMGYHKGTVTLDRIVTDPAVGNLDLKKVRLRMNPKTNSTMFIESGAGRCSLCSGFGGSVIKSTELQNGDTVMIMGKGADEAIKIKITYSLN